LSGSAGKPCDRAARVPTSAQVAAQGRGQAVAPRASIAHCALALTFWIFAAAFLVGSNALAQTAPAGNAHPDLQEVSDFGGANPFAPAPGAPAAPSMDVAAKLAFSKQVDLEPLRDLALFHNGRVKILDTLARETVSTITGRSRYFDYIVAADNASATKVKRARFDPLFTYMDMLIDPDFYAGRPLIGVEFLPLREAFLEKLYTTKAEIEWWKRDGRLKPADIARVWEPVAQEQGFNPAARKSLDHINRSMKLFQFASGELLMKAPDAAEKPWHHLSELPPGPAAEALKELGAAWRAGDAARVNAAAKTLAAELPRINAPFYPTTKRTMERLYNSSNAFEWGFWMYALALVTLLLAFGTGRKWLIAFGVAALAAALGLHAFGFTARSIIAERFAIQNQFESMTGLSLFAVTVGTAIMLARRQWLFGAAAAGVGFMVLVTATQTGIPGMTIDREAPILNTSVLLKYHVTTVLLSYGLISLGFLVSVFYLVTHYAAKLKLGAAPAGSVVLATPGGGAVAVSAAAMGLGDDEAAAGTGSAARVLSDLDKAQMIVLQLAFWGLGVGILLGAWWADHSWGRWWAFDPKELWALVTWIVYLVVIHLRFTTGRNRALITAWLSVLGFIVMLWTYFGVNLLLPGLHAYA
jgi:cytochrome c-type biogenesis protein CcsB